jgi:hypothetical protein
VIRFGGRLWRSAFSDQFARKGWSRQCNTAERGLVVLTMISVAHHAEWTEGLEPTTVDGPAATQGGSACTVLARAYRVFKCDGLGLGLGLGLLTGCLSVKG